MAQMPTHSPSPSIEDQNQGRGLSRPFKVAFVIPNCGGGGAEPMIIRLANEFASRGHTVDLVLFNAEGPNLSQISSEVQIVDLKVHQLLLAPLAIRAYLKRQCPDVAISALFHANIFTLLARRLLPFSRTRVIVSERNMLSIHVKHSKRLTRPAFKTLAWLLYRFADQVVGISKGVAADIQSIAGLPDRKVSVIYNPAATPALAGAIDFTTGGLPSFKQDGPLIVSIGRLEPQKDHQTLLRAFKKLLQRRSATLVIAGDGSLKQELLDTVVNLQLEPRVVFAGYVNNPTQLMKTADLFVLSSLYEGFGNVLVEALMCGLKIVSTDCPSGPAEILSNGEYGLLVPPGDESALAEAMERALSLAPNPERQRQRGDEFSLKRSADAFEALVVRVIA